MTEGRPEIMGALFAIYDRLYRAFIIKRWLKFAKGSGNWKRLKPATIRAKGHALILIDTKLAIQTVEPAFQEFFSVKPDKRTIYRADVSFGSNAVYDNGKTVNQVMGYHQVGGGHLPQRKVLISPDGPTKRAMEVEGKEKLKEMLNQGDG